MSQRTGSNCEDVCQEHSGLKTMIMVVLVGVVGTLAMQTYNNFFATTEIKTSIAELRGELNGIRSEMKSTDAALEKRVSSLEYTVFKKR